MTDRPMSAGVFTMFLLVLAILYGQMGFTHYQLRQETAELRARFDAQTANVVAAQRLRGQLEGIAGAVAQLAEDGNENAILVRDQLQIQGIQIRPARR